MALNKFSRKSAEKAPGEIKMQKTPDVEDAGTRNNTKTKVKSFSIRLDLLDKVDAYRTTHRTESGTIPSASQIVNEALEAYLR